MNFLDMLKLIVKFEWKKSKSSEYLPINRRQDLVNIT